MSEHLEQLLDQKEGEIERLKEALRLARRDLTAAIEEIDRELSYGIERCHHDAPKGACTQCFLIEKIAEMNEPTAPLVVRG